MRVKNLVVGVPDDRLVLAFTDERDIRLVADIDDLLIEPVSNLYGDPFF